MFSRARRSSTGSAKKLGVTRSGGNQAATAGRSLDFAILYQRLHEIIERHRFQLTGAYIAFFACYLQQALDQIRELINLLIYSHSCGLAIGRGSRQLGRKT